MTNDELYDSLKNSPDWCECSEYPSMAHCHFQDGSHGAPFVSNAEVFFEINQLLGLIKGYKKDDTLKGSQRLNELQHRMEIVGTRNIEAAQNFYMWQREERMVRIERNAH